MSSRRQQRTDKQSRSARFEALMAAARAKKATQDKPQPTKTTPPQQEGRNHAS